MVSGVVNRGDSFRRRRSRSNSLAPPGLLPQEIPNLPTVPAPPQDVTTYRVALIGAQGVGRTALISQFMSSECINAYDRSHCEYFFSNLTFPPPLHSFFPPSTPPLPSLSPHIPSLPLVSAELKKKKRIKIPRLQSRIGKVKRSFSQVRKILVRLSIQMSLAKRWRPLTHK